MKSALFWNPRLYAISMITDALVTDAWTKLRSDLQQKLRREQANLTRAIQQPERRSQLMVALSVETAVLCRDLIYEYRDSVDGNCCHSDPSVRATASLYLARGPVWMQRVSLAHKGSFHHRLIRAFTPTRSVLEWKHPLLAADLSVGPGDADSISEVEPLTMQMVECLICQKENP